MKSPPFEAAAKYSFEPAFDSPFLILFAAAVLMMAAPNTFAQSLATNVVINYTDFKARPFVVMYETPNFQWTHEDGRDTNIIRHLAHNDGEFRRMTKENETIYRRQLVYHKTQFSALAQQAIQTGQPVQQLTLPALDGLELPVTVTRTDFKNGGEKGVFYGKLTGDPKSMVTVAFVKDREAFTVISPQNRIYIQAEAREPGEIVVKEINPGTYGNMQQ